MNLEECLQIVRTYTLARKYVMVQQGNHRASLKQHRQRRLPNSLRARGGSSWTINQSINQNREDFALSTLAEGAMGHCHTVETLSGDAKEM